MYPNRLTTASLLYSFYPELQVSYRVFETVTMLCGISQRWRVSVLRGTSRSVRTLPDLPGLPARLSHRRNRGGAFPGPRRTLRHVPQREARLRPLPGVGEPHMAKLPGLTNSPLH